MHSLGFFLRQQSGKEGWKSTSRRWEGEDRYNNVCGKNSGSGFEANLTQMEELNMHTNGVDNDLVSRKRVMVVVDQSSHSKHVVMWALTHIVSMGDLLTSCFFSKPKEF